MTATSIAVTVLLYYGVALSFIEFIGRAFALTVDDHQRGTYKLYRALALAVLAGLVQTLLLLV